MSAKFYVGVNLFGRPQYYVRDIEKLINNRWTAQPNFDPELSRALKMEEPTALILVKRLRLLREDPWIQTMEGQRLTPPEDGQPQFIPDTRVKQIGTLDDETKPEAKWYFIHPANTPLGPRWFIRYDLPGRPKGQDTVFADEPMACLERAKMLHVLDFCEKAPAPTPKPPTPIKVGGGNRHRPGDLI
jgi:hypothetical protein